MAPNALYFTVLTADEEAMIVAFRRPTLRPLDDCLYALQPTIPHLIRGRRKGLKVPKRQLKRRRLWLGDGSCIRLRQQHRGHIWS